MASKESLRQRIAFRQTALDKLYAAYTALVSGGVKSYMIDDRQLTRLDLTALKQEINALEKEIDILTTQMNGGRSRKAFGVVPRDW